MSKIGIDKIMELLERENLIEYPKELGLETEGIEVELRLGRAYKFKLGSDVFIEIVNRSTPKTELIASYNPDKKFNDQEQEKIEIKPEDYFLVETIEKLNTPPDLFPEVAPRTTLQRCGLVLVYSTTSPGYKGSLTFGLYNAGPKIVSVRMGAKIAKLSFSRIEGESKLYNGQWQHGRVSTNGEIEKQTDNRM
jgi:deoxycytidine triphosphate deaminase